MTKHQSGYYTSPCGNPFHAHIDNMSDEGMAALGKLVDCAVDALREGKIMECALWFVDTAGLWQLFYGYDNFHDAITDARGTLGIDQWAIVRQTTIVAFSKSAAYRVIFLSQMLKRNRRML